MQILKRVGASQPSLYEKWLSQLGATNQVSLTPGEYAALPVELQQHIVRTRVTRAPGKHHAKPLIVITLSSPKAVRTIAKHQHKCANAPGLRGA